MKDLFQSHVLQMVNEDPQLLEAWNSLSESTREMFRQIDAGKRVPCMLEDTMFKGIFDPSWNRDWLSRLISAILGQSVVVIEQLGPEGVHLSRESKSVYFDILVKLENGCLAIVEVQRKGILMPPQRAAIYSAQAVVRQFATGRDEAKGSVNYIDVRPVHTIILLENSPKAFLKYTDFHHYFHQMSDTGLDLELLQYYHYICLDVFREHKPRVGTQLFLWLDFLSITDVAEMMVFLSEHPEFNGIYARAFEMLADREELLKMLAAIGYEEDIAESINRTNEAQLQYMTQELAESKRLLREKDEEIRNLKEQLATAGLPLK